MDRRQRVTRFDEPRYPYPGCPTAGSWWPRRPRSPRRGAGAAVLRPRPSRRTGPPTARPACSMPTAPTSGPTSRWAAGSRTAAARCPFHGWRFDGALGECVEIPYGGVTRIPPKAHARSYPTLERNHMIWAWYQAQGGEPFYDVPEVPEFHDDDWSPIVVRAFEVRVSAQDMAENNVDFSHFRYVHGTEAIPDDDLFTDGTYKRTVAGGRQLHPRGLRPRARGAAHHRLRDVPFVDHAARRRQRPGPLGLHRPEGQRRACRAPTPTRSAPGSRRTSRSGRTRSTGTHRSSRRPRSSSSSTGAGHSSSTPSSPELRS